MNEEKDLTGEEQDLYAAYKQLAPNMKVLLLLILELLCSTDESLHIGEVQ